MIVSILALCVPRVFLTEVRVAGSFRRKIWELIVSLIQWDFLPVSLSFLPLSLICLFVSNDDDDVTRLYSCIIHELHKNRTGTLPNEQNTKQWVVCCF